MSFIKIIEKISRIDFDNAFNQISENDILKTLSERKSEEKDLLALLSPKALEYIERIAQSAHKISLRNFGKTIQLYTPLYLANYCDNSCVYCGFKTDNNLQRKILNYEQLESEAYFLSQQGFEHILILTGSSRRHTPPSFIAGCVEKLKKYFSSISIEVYALGKDEYKELISIGVDGLTIYQEVYNQDIYKKVHPAGPKSDYKFRLDAPERAAKVNMRCINIGVLLGLGPWREEFFKVAMHAKYLQDNYPQCEISVSVPRLRPYAGEYKEVFPVSDIDLVQSIVSLRVFLPRVGITLSTRETERLRNDLLPLGITKMSAGSTTAVGGHTSEFSESNQFEIADNRSLEEVINMLKNKNYQPVLKDWMIV